MLSNMLSKIKRLWREKKKYIIILLCILCIGCLILLKISIINRSKNILIEEDDELEEIEVVDEKIDAEFYYVDIKGAIANPGVYKLKKGSRVKDVIELAGGLTSNSDTSSINLAKIIDDEMVIIIDTRDGTNQNYSVNNDASINYGSNNSSSENSNGLININIASIEELMTLSGIGESKANAIISYRKENGNFKSIEEIMNVSGIGQAIYEKIKNNITV